MWKSVKETCRENGLACKYLIYFIFIFFRFALVGFDFPTESFEFGAWSCRQAITWRLKGKAPWNPCESVGLPNKRGANDRYRYD